MYNDWALDLDDFMDDSMYAFDPRVHLTAGYKELIKKHYAACVEWLNDYLKTCKDSTAKSIQKEVIALDSGPTAPFGINTLDLTPHDEDSYTEAMFSVMAMVSGLMRTAPVSSFTLDVLQKLKGMGPYSCVGVGIGLGQYSWQLPEGCDLVLSFAGSGASESDGFGTFGGDVFAEGVRVAELGGVRIAEVLEDYGGCRSAAVMLRIAEVFGSNIKVSCGVDADACSDWSKQFCNIPDMPTTKWTYKHGDGDGEIQNRPMPPCAD